MSEETGLRYNAGKTQWSLVDFDAIEDMVKVLEFGAEKYSANNWKKGLSVSEILDSMQRHINALRRGENIDLESNLPHWGHIGCNYMFLEYMMKYKLEMDDRYKDENKNIN